MLQYELCLIVPCYNEELRLQTNTFKDFIEENPSIYFCFINDGSTDQTMDSLDDISKGLSNAGVIHIKKNIGKAEAIRSGYLEMSCRHGHNYYAYLDSDLSTPLAEVSRLLSIIKEQNLSMVFGSRVATFGTNIKRHFLRHYTARIFATLVSLTLRIPIYDTQCGVKIFTSELSSAIFKHPFIDRWLFDIEIFARIKKIYDNELIKYVREIPLDHWLEISGTKLKFIDAIRIPVSLIKINIEYRKVSKYPANVFSVNQR
ncbi:glycosyltransferase [Pedobacter psychrodurus]|jgi:dolichyl-phosphate beta-glucosyltransferase|uniref:glycosyltransferase n=1 Tax=Pedobacter psychrodurus TaxID=2530456 RepID=UPI00292EF7F1|nr:glycosyltransferase [Pedobacter psychrodurus]